MQGNENRSPSPPDEKHKYRPQNLIRFHLQGRSCVLKRPPTLPTSTGTHCNDKRSGNLPPSFRAFCTFSLKHYREEPGTSKCGHGTVFSGLEIRVILWSKSSGTENFNSAKSFLKFRSTSRGYPFFWKLRKFPVLFGISTLYESALVPLVVKKLQDGGESFESTLHCCMQSDLPQF